MKKVYQKKIDKYKGDCLQAVIASLFEEELNTVPKFIEFGDRWFHEVRKYINNKGYDYLGMVHNQRRLLITGHEDNYKNMNDKAKQSMERIKNYEGIDGYFYAAVLSPKYYVKEDRWDATTHAVIIDRDCNIVHDPSPVYQELKKYPEADILEYNGIIHVNLIEKIKK